MIIQLIILKIQHQKPRFLIPKNYRQLIIPDYYRYERRFESEVEKNSTGLLKLSTNSKDFDED
jgi:hypothetical protein